MEIFKLRGRGHKYQFLDKEKFFRFFFTAWTIAQVNWEYKNTNVYEKFLIIKELEETKWTKFCENENLGGNFSP